MNENKTLSSDYVQIRFHGYWENRCKEMIKDFANDFNDNFYTAERIEETLEEIKTWIYLIKFPIHINTLDYWKEWIYEHTEGDCSFDSVSNGIAHFSASNPWD